MVLLCEYKRFVYLLPDNRLTTDKIRKPNYNSMYATMAGMVPVSSFGPASCFKVGGQERITQRHCAYMWTLGHMLKEPTHIQAHLVFADTQSPNKKPKELEFLPTLGRNRKEKE
jgi:hypothetical protein